MPSRVVFFVRWFRKFYRPISQMTKRSTLSTSVLSGNYQRHYTLSAQTSDTQVFLDVQIASAVQFGPTSISESGTLTVSQTVQQNGSLMGHIVAL